MKDNISNSPLKELPQGFDRSVIKSRVKGVGANLAKVYFSKCDFLPMERNGFSGWFAYPDIICNCSVRRSSRINNIVNAGGTCEFALIGMRKNAEKTVKVRIVEAFMDRGNVVVHIERVDSPVGTEGE